MVSKKTTEPSTRPSRARWPTAAGSSRLAARDELDRALLGDRRGSERPGGQGKEGEEAAGDPVHGIATAVTSLTSVRSARNGGSCACASSGFPASTVQ